MNEIKINILGCGYIGKKVAMMLKSQQPGLKCYVNTEASLKACEERQLSVEQIDFDQSVSHFITAEQFTGSNCIYLVPPPPAGKVDLRMENFIQQLELAGAVPGKIVLISTTGVYGDCGGDWIDENRPVKPQADRAHRRLSAEVQLQDYCNKNHLSLIIFRVPGIYAADKLPLKRITSGEPIVKAEDSGYTNRIHAYDLAAFCVEALTRDVESGVYNCCDGEPSTMNDYFMKVAEAKGFEKPAEISLQEAQQQLSPGMLSYLAESKRISNKKLLDNFQTGFRYRNLEAGLKDIEQG